MGFTNVIIKALGLQHVSIEKVEEFPAELRLVIHATQEFEHCRCHACKNSFIAIHEWRTREILAPPLGAFIRVQIQLQQLRGICYICGDVARSAAVSFVHPQFQNMTLSLFEWAGRMMEEITCQATARLLGLNPKTLWSLDQWRMRYMKKQLQLPKDLDLSKMSADEVHFMTMPKVDSLKKPEIKFVTNLVCYKESKVLANAPGRDGNALVKCLMTLSPEQLARIKSFAVDMHEPFIAVIKQLCPQAEICVDRFHLAERVNEAFDEVRRAEFKKASEANDSFQAGMLAPHRRFVLVEREKKLSQKDLKMLDQLKELNKNILNAMILVEHFHKVLDKTDVGEFRKSLLLWYRLVRESELRPFRKLARLIKKYRAYIESYVRSKLTTAVSEGLNNKIKVLKRMGYGYTNERSFLNKILQRCGFLNSRYIDTTSWFWSLPVLA
jgi:transposase